MFEEMKAYLERGGDEGQFGYDDPYADYVNNLYIEAETELGNEMEDPDMFIEPSIQVGTGRVDMYSKNGTTHWDFESECETLAELAMEADSEEEFKNAIKGFLMGKYEECVPEEDEDEDEEDDEYEGSPDEDDE